MGDERSAPRRIGFVSTRFAGTDGVSLEAAKWATILERRGHHCFWFAGLSDRPAERSHVVPEAHYRHPAVEAMHRMAFAGDWGTAEQARAAHPEIAALRRPYFSMYIRPPALTRAMSELRERLKDELYRFAARFELDLLVIENASAIPVHLPLGMAIAEFIAETGYPTIAHHHDLPWERQRFLVNCVHDILDGAFPPSHPAVRHVVINSMQQAQLAWRRGLAARVIPNVMEFERRETWGVRRTATVRAELRGALGIEAGRLLILQPTRVVARKGIEQAVEFVRRLERPATLVISHASGDEGTEYARRIHEYADLLRVDLRMIDEIVTDRPGRRPDGLRTFSLDEVYRAADFVTYPSTIEGFGNAFLEAVYHRRPILVNNYSTYEVDLRPRGFRVVWFDGSIGEDTIRLAHRLLDDPAEAAAWADHNHRIAQRYFGFRVLERHLDDLLIDCFGTNGGSA